MAGANYRNSGAGSFRILIEGIKGRFTPLFIKAMIKNVFLDLDDTIFDFKKAEAAALSKTLTEHGLEPTPAIVSRYSQINESLWKALERKEVTREQVLLNRFKILFDEFGIDCNAWQVKTCYENHLGQGHYFIDGAEALLDALYGKYKLFLASNGTTHVQKGRIASSGIARYFDEIFISQDVGINKPDIGYFNYCFSKIENFRKEETVIIGDSLSSDINGGKNAGIHTCWFNPHGAPMPADNKPDFTVKTLVEIPRLLEKI